MILLRRASGRRATEVAALLLANLDTVRDHMAWAVVVDGDRSMRVRRLPFF
ncbi:MAG: hypothetical protein ACRDJB_11485 [Actinomycetota bacterium]